MHRPIFRALALLTALCATACSWSDIKVAPAAPAATTPSASTDPNTASRGGPVVIDHTVKNIDGEDVALSSYRGKALLIVNTASECGFTPQYEGLQSLYEKYQSRGLVVLGFPCNDFGGQEPGSQSEIKSFCSSKFHVTFPLFDKVRAKGEKSPLYKTLTEEVDPTLRGDIKWNFTKFLVDPSGHVVARFEPMVKPLDPEMLSQIEKVLPQ